MLTALTGAGVVARRYTRSRPASCGGDPAAARRRGGRRWPCARPGRGAAPAAGVAARAGSRAGADHRDPASWPCRSPARSPPPASAISIRTSPASPSLRRRAGWAAAERRAPPAGRRRRRRGTAGRPRCRSRPLRPGRATFAVLVGFAAPASADRAVLAEPPAGPPRGHRTRRHRRRRTAGTAGAHAVPQLSRPAPGRPGSGLAAGRRPAAHDARIPPSRSPRPPRLAGAAYAAAEVLTHIDGGSPRPSAPPWRSPARPDESAPVEPPPAM